MASNKKFRLGPVAMSATLTTNILNPGSVTGGVACGTPNLYIVIYHIHILNKTAGAVTFSLYLGATGGNVAGTEVVGTAYSIAANSVFDHYCNLRLDSADFLVGGASAGTSLVLTAEGEIGIA